MAKDLTTSVSIASPSRNVISRVEIDPLRDRPRVAYRCRGMLPRLLADETPASNELGKPAYDEPLASWEYAREVTDPALVAELLTEATTRVLLGAGTVDWYTALEETAIHLEDRLAAGEILPVATVVIRGLALLTEYGIPAEAAQPSPEPGE